MPSHMEVVAESLGIIARTCEALDQLAVYMDQAIARSAERELLRRDIWNGSPHCAKEQDANPSK